MGDRLAVHYKLWLRRVAKASLLNSWGCGVGFFKSA